MTVDGAVIAREQHRHLPARRLLQERVQRRALEPLAGELPQRDLIALSTEIYDNITSTQARHVDIAVRIVSEDGKEVFAVRDTLENGGVAPKKAWQLYGYSKELALNKIAIAPGRYALRLQSPHDQVAQFGRHLRTRAEPFGKARHRLMQQHAQAIDRA